MRKKERALAEIGAVRFERVVCPTETRRVLDAFFKQKSARMRSIGVSDAFAAPDVRRFIEAGTTERLATGEPLIELYALSVDDIIVATMGGIVGGGRFCAMFNSILPGPLRRRKPRRAIDRQPGAAMLRARSGDLRPRHRRSRATSSSVLRGRRTAVRQLFAAQHAGTFARQGLSAERGHSSAPSSNIRSLWSLVRASRRLRARLKPPL